MSPCSRSARCSRSGWPIVGFARGGRASVYEQTRQGIGRSILLGLEILIIADIVQTITIDPTLESAATLGVIVVVRVLLSFSLEIELEGALPWRRGSARRRALTGPGRAWNAGGGPPVSRRQAPAQLARSSPSRRASPPPFAPATAWAMPRTSAR